MIRIGFTGLPGTGKTTLARMLSAELPKSTSLNNIELVSEYARRYISKYEAIESIWDQYLIMQKQLDWEDSVGTEVQAIVTDSPVFLGLVYCLELKRGTIKDSMVFSEIMDKMLKLNIPPRYDFVFHLLPKVEPSRDGLRPDIHFDEDWRKDTEGTFHFIHRLFPPKNLYIVEQESVEDRLDFCLYTLKGRLGL